MEGGRKVVVSALQFACTDSSIDNIDHAESLVREAHKKGANIVLIQSLYGLKQSPRCWFQRLREALHKFGMVESRTDPSVFFNKQGSFKLFICVYIDDIIITSSDSAKITCLLDSLGEEFPVKDLGDLNFFLGIEVNRVKAGLHLSQSQYIANLLQSCDMTNIKPTATPMVPNVDLNKEAELLADPTEFRRIIGSLQYVTLTRPDVQLAVNKLSQYMSKPNTLHWISVKRVLRFLAGTITQGILLRPMIGTEITAFCDADWGGDTSDRKSRTGLLVYVGGSLIAWCSRKQGTVARSSTEAEYRAIATTTQEIEAVRVSLSELGVQVPFPMKIYTDNLGASFIARNPIAHTRLKHVALDLHFVRERSEKGELLIEHIPGSSQQADILTKPLPPQNFASFSTNLVTSLELAQRGGCVGPADSGSISKSAGQSQIN